MLFLVSLTVQVLPSEHNKVSAVRKSNKASTFSQLNNTIFLFIFKKVFI